jgi:hypothetical protein
MLCVFALIGLGRTAFERTHRHAAAENKKATEVMRDSRSPNGRLAEMPDEWTQSRESAPESAPRRGRDEAREKPAFNSDNATRKKGAELLVSSGRR